MGTRNYDCKKEVKIKMNIGRTNYLEKLRFAANRNKREGDYWLNRLGGEWTKSTFPYNYANRKAISSASRVERMEFRLGGEQFSKLLQFSNDSDLRLHMILAAGVAALLCKYTGNDDIIVGTPIYKQEVEGEFTNTLLPLRYSLTPDMTFKELLLQVRQIIREAVENQD
jgi:fengycin family lipopeptide synthetase E